MNPPIASDAVAIDRGFFPEALSAVEEESEVSARGSDKAERSGTIQPLHDGDNEKLAPLQSSFDAFALGVARRTGKAVPSAGSDEEKPTTGRARVLQRRGRALVRELVRMAESMPAEARRLSASEVKSVTRKIWKCDWSGLLAWRLWRWTGFSWNS